MTRVFLLTMCLTGIATVGAAGEIFDLRVPVGFSGFALVDGRLFLLKSQNVSGAGIARQEGTRTVWFSLARRDGDTTVYSGDRRTGRKLGYGLSGDDKNVVLSMESKGLGFEWRQANLGRAAGFGGDTSAITLQAAAGKLAGWYLDCAEKGEDLKLGGQSVVGHRLILSQTPTRIKYFVRVMVAP